MQEFVDLLASDHVMLFSLHDGFALARTVADESELLTLAVDPGAQRQGIGRALVRDWLANLAGTATRAFLEVAADNSAALALYQSEGFAEVGCRSAYYRRKNEAPADAVILARDLTQGNGAKTTTRGAESG